ncbi:MAG: hypothetical protein A2168_00840 [Planctomycetes bacterium RBG_13_50_24]|nr:MAG: hypothetical protein A2168_00840 [Planctomycetes bacterium RBG_13_50_24]
MKYGRKKVYFALITLLVVTALLPVRVCLAGTEIDSGEGVNSSAAMPSEWMQAWSNPGCKLRPMQIVHGLAPQQASQAGIEFFKDLGLGGIVCNVSFDRYLQSEENWNTLAHAVKNCSQLGLRVWIYDEDGYPSGSAGGLVLKENPDYEALSLTYDSARREPFALRRAYEHTHASNNYGAARRYPNLIDEKAIKSFVEITHRAYRQRLSEYFGNTIEAFFTDEPSLIAVNIGALPDSVRKNVRVVDPLDETLAPLASVPWVPDLPQLYQQRYGEDINASRQSLFLGDKQEDRKVRRQFWALISDLVAQRYFGRLQEWAAEYKVASSGHALWEEMPLHHVPLYGNALKSLLRMDIPGLDMLSSDPQAVIYTGWMTAILPASAALFNGGRKVMTEVSDFSQVMDNGNAASLEHMQATAAWQAAMGVTEFTLYYDYRSRSAEDYRSYCDYVGRLNAVLRDARPACRVLLYYPIYDLWSEYLPIPGKLTVESQPDRAQMLVNSFMELGQQMVRRQLTFALADHELLSRANVRDSQLDIQGHRFGAIALPAGVVLPETAREKIEQFQSNGGIVIRPATQGAGIDFEKLSGLYAGGSLSTPNDRIVLGRFQRNGREVLVLVNVSSETYHGDIECRNSAAWLAADPGTGIIKAATTEAGKVKISLKSRSAILLIGAAPTIINN